MELVFDKSFSKSIDKLNDNTIKEKIAQVFIDIEAAESLAAIANVKKMQGLKLIIG
ncbi:hypothetical protein [Mucilaginibacter flavus]|uniref:hypothetical protein n=1 Tax=Mucilaginibacter flavus TaxID=931504 RepID=UPI0025B3C091|nr:hypothetical protein [Mucilaginibacter flavus]MDN3582841.1 hypothetical protein [Mucilaginibacter flavus]